MSLFPCPQCGREISQNAAACPQCGNPHPFIANVAARRKSNGCAGILAWIFGGIGLVAVIAALGGHQSSPQVPMASDAHVWEVEAPNAKPSTISQEAQSKSESDRNYGESVAKNRAAASAIQSDSCVNDYKACKDNEELVNRHVADDDISITVMCKLKAEAIVRFGEAELPWVPFRVYNKGTDFIDSGYATLIEPDTKVQNKYGAKEHVRAVCRYDLRRNIPSVTFERY